MASHICSNKVEPTKDQEPASAIKSIRSFTERTTMHGCQSITQTDYHVIRRLAWGALMLVSTGFFLSAFIRGIIRYRSYPSSISVDIQPNQNLPLPDVTVCNNNLIRRSFVESHDEALHSMVPHFTNISREAVPVLSRFDYVTFYFDGIDPMEEFISNCVYDMIPFDCQKHTKPSLSWSGACYTLSVADFVADRTRSLNGLSFQITINESEYLLPKSHMDGVGVKLMFHEHGQLAESEHEVRLQPDTDVYVAVRKSQNNRLGTPYSRENCYAEQYVNYTLSSLYTLEGCQFECYVRYFREIVGCDITGKIEELRNCSLLEGLAHTEAAYDFELSEECPCLRPCRETIFSTHVSALAHRDTLTTPRDRVKRIAVNVYYPTLDTIIISQSPTYRVDSFVADVGGQMGLFLGASILTLTEFLEYFLVRVVTLFYKN